MSKAHCCPHCGKEAMIMTLFKHPPLFRGRCTCGYSTPQFDKITEVEALLPFQEPQEYISHRDTGDEQT